MNKIPDLINKKIIGIRRIAVEVEPVTEAFLSVGGGDAHKQLATLAAGYLVSIDQTPDYERHYGKRVDVSSTDGKWRIECGDTDGNPIPDHLRNGCDHFGVMPFCADGEPVYLYIFERGENWSNYKPRIANEGVHLE